MITKVDHIGIAVGTLQQRLPFWQEALALPLGGVETVDSEQVKVAFLAAGESCIELLEPTGDDSPIARHLAKRGEGIHHLTFAVSDIDALLDRLKQRGVEVVGEAPRRGAGGSAVAFIHPRSTGGVLVELVERPAAPVDDVVPGNPVLLYLRDPSEKLWGLLRRLDGAGVVVEGLDLGSFDDWIAQLEGSDGSPLGPTVLFVPMSRVDKILLDRPSGDIPSLSARVERRSRCTVAELFDRLRT